MYGIHFYRNPGDSSWRWPVVVAGSFLAIAMLCPNSIDKQREHTRQVEAEATKQWCMGRAKHASELPPMPPVASKLFTRDKLRQTLEEPD